MSSPHPLIKTQASTPNIGTIASPASATVLHSTEPSRNTTTSSTYPDASLFTFIPELYLAISRLNELRHPLPSVITNGINGADNTGADAVLTHIASRESAHSSSSGTRFISDPNSASIEIRDLPSNVYNIKKGITAAKEVVRGLPDIERSVEEQEEELRELGRVIGGLRRRLGELGAIAERSRTGNEDVVMTGDEGAG